MLIKNTLSVIVVMLLSLCVLSSNASSHQEKRPTPNEIFVAAEYLPEDYRQDVRVALRLAGFNGQELIRAIYASSRDERESLGFILANMPRRDLKELTGQFLLEDIRLAQAVLTEVPWGSTIPRDIFLNYVLPYSNFNEERKPWRGDLHGRFINTAREKITISQAALALNQEALKKLEVSYNPYKRPKPDQSPHESMTAHYASCTGLSILLVDVFRSVGIPSRVVGVPMWSDQSGNHTWIEIWEGGAWHYLGAGEPGGLNEGWFSKKTAKINPRFPQKIYAASFKRTNLKFPLAWDPNIHYIYADDVTERYRR